MRAQFHIERRVRVLTVSSEERDHVTLAQIFNHTSWSIEGVDNISSAAEKMTSDPCPVVLCEENLPDGDWRDIFALAETLSHPPHVIVLSRTADEKLWAEVLNRGGYDVLAKPLQAAEVLRAIGVAWRGWMDCRRVQNGTAGGSEVSTMVAGRIA